MIPGTLTARAKIFWLAGLLAIVSSTALVLLADDADNTQWAAPARAKRAKNPVDADAKSIASGRQLYTAQCLECHGKSCRGDGPSASEFNEKPTDLTDSNVTGQSDGALFWKITTGRNHMPAFETLASEDQRWDVVNYLRSIAPPASTQPAKAK